MYVNKITKWEENIYIKKKNVEINAFAKTR